MLSELQKYRRSLIHAAIMADLPDNSRTNLIINYLPQTLSDAEFNQLFAALGPLQSARILRDKRTGYSFGYGFVNYQKEEDATKGLWRIIDEKVNLRDLFSTVPLSVLFGLCLCWLHEIAQYHEAIFEDDERTVLARDNIS